MASTGQTIERYTVERVLGEGAMAKVYAVRHDTLDTRHALKILTGGNKSIHQRLVREGRVQASLRQENVVAVTDVFYHNEAPVLLMELVEGPDLDEYLAEHSPTLDEALAIFGGILSGVRSAHNKDITHRDLKPGNVLLHIADGVITPKVADFGLAKALDGGMNKTKAGVTMGTPAYMAPEQIRDASTADKRADIFSLGCILYELVCGRRCFLGDDIFAIFSKIATSDYPAPRQLMPELPQEVVDAIEGALKTELDERFPDCDALALALFGKKRGFTTVIDEDSVGGQAAAKLWHEQQSAVEPLLESHTFAMSLPSAEDRVEHEVEKEEVNAEKPPVETQSMTRFYVGVAGVTAALIGAIFLIAAGLLFVMQRSDSPSVPALSSEGSEAISSEEPKKVEQPQESTEPSVVKPVDNASTSGKSDKAREEPPATPIKPVSKPIKAASKPIKSSVKPVDSAPKPSKPVEPSLEEPPVKSTAPSEGTSSLARFSVSGDATQVSLIGGGGVYRAGEPLPGGRYEVEANFGAGVRPAGNVLIRAGQAVQLKCVSMMARCSVK